MELVVSGSLKDIYTSDRKHIEGIDDGVKISWNVVVDDDFDEQKLSELVPEGCIKSVTFVGEKKADKNMGSVKCYNEYTLDTLSERQAYSGVTDIVRLPEDYHNLRELQELSKQYDGIRFIGGKLLNIGGFNIGRTENTPFVCCGVYDFFAEGNFGDVEGMQSAIDIASSVLTAKEQKVKKSKGGSKPKGEKKHSEPSEKKVSKKVGAFNSMFGGEAVEF